MSGAARYPPETAAALDALAAVYWRAAVEQVEQELIAETTKPRIERVQLIRRVTPPLKPTEAEGMTTS